MLTGSKEVKNYKTWELIFIIYKKPTATNFKFGKHVLLAENWKGAKGALLRATKICVLKCTDTWFYQQC